MRPSTPPRAADPIPDELDAELEGVVPIDDAQLNKAQKFIRLLESMQAQGGITTGEVISRFGLDDRTLRRYLADLRELGLPVHASGRGHERKLWIDATYRRSGVQLSLLELVSLRFGRSLFNFLEGTSFADDMDEALERLSTIAIGHSRELARSLDRKFLAVPEHRRDHSEDGDLIDDILSALLYQNPARAHYARVGSPTRAYHLHPYTLATYRQSLYLFALDVEENKVKTFALSRFRNFERVKGERFVLREDYQPEDVIKDSFGIMGGPVRQVSLLFNRRAAPYIKEQRWHASQAVSAVEGGRVRLSMRVGLSPELTRWILGFGPDVQVESPSELAEEVMHLHAQAASGADPARRGEGE